MNRDDFLERAVARLKAAGFRITKPRLVVLELLAFSKEALGVQEIYTRLKQQKKSLDLVSVYRIIDCLEKERLVHRDPDTGGYFCCLHCECCPNTLHIFLKCRSCSNIKEIDFHGTIFTKSFKEMLARLKAPVDQGLIYLNQNCATCR